MQIPENATTKDLTIQGIKFQVPVVVTAEDFCESIEPVMSREMAAKILQQTLMENWRNNFAKTVTDAIKAVAAEHGIEFKKVSDLSDDDAAVINEYLDTDALQEKLNEYISSYEPGVRKTGGGGPALSPVDREAHKLAVELIKDHLEKELGVGRTARSETYRAWDAKIQEELGITGAEYIQQLAEQLLEENPSIRETAEKNVAARQALASGVSLSVA